ncbi:hypothetical protein [Parapedobacter tibetensis]|uniref:hypothetical protein n=1 Tax=Parapedobacter tibetensis TaxID=2972951 RepID=UPI00214D4935|nr:hypothetical protein [Parapedobacter tibetensis]
MAMKIKNTHFPVLGIGKDRKIRCIWLAVGFLAINLLSNVQAQVTPPVLPNNVPPSPTAAGLGQYGEIEVGHYSGLPNVGIPLYAYSQGGYDFNIGLSYQNAGLRYLDEASLVGLGWSLGSSGVITRSIKGVEDLMPSKGFSRIPTSQMDPTNADAEPDIFYFNVNGKVGKFLLPYAPGTRIYAKLINQQEDIQIYLDWNNNFTMTTPDGIIYRFEKKEMSHVTTSSNSSADRITSWFLSNIQLTNGELINFVYKANPVRLISSTLQTYRINVINVQALGGSTAVSTCVNNHINDLWINQTVGSGTASQTDEVLLDRIEAKNGKIEFGYSARNDIGATGGTPSKLQSMTVRDGENAILRQFTFGYGYFTSGNSNTVVGNRLKLISITETGNGVNNQSKVHSFGYYEGTIPNKTHLTGKYFGFYDSNPTVALLRKITYPTKGYTEFTYGNHDYSVTPGNVPGIPFKDLGVRIDQLANFDVNGDTLLNRQFQYKRQDANGALVPSGKLISYATNYYEPPKEMVTRYCHNPQTNINEAIPFNVSRQINYSSSIVPLGGSSTVVGYDQVTVIDRTASGDNGKTDYHFINNPDGYNAIVPGLQGTHNYKNGTLLMQREYRLDVSSSEFKLLRESKYQYQYVGNTQYLAKVYVPRVGIFGYGISSFKSRPEEVIETLHESTSNILETKRTFTYNSNYLQPEIMETVSSAGKAERLSKRYPYHFSSIFPYNEMVSHNIVTPVVEEIHSLYPTVLYTTSNIYKRVGTASQPVFVLDSVKTKKGGEGFEERMVLPNYTEKGKLLHASMIDGPPKALQWDQSEEYVVAELTNANNRADTYRPRGYQGNLTVPIIEYSSNTVTVYTRATGDITVQLVSTSSLPTGTSLTLNYSITGPVSKSGQICASNTPSHPCYNTSNNVHILSGAPPGVYTITITSASTIYGSVAAIRYTYIGGDFLLPELKDFFYEGFEEVSGAATTTPYAGKRYRSGTYTVPFTKPDGREYTVEYRYLQNGKWIFQKKVYQNNMVLNEGTAIDEVRVYPAGAGMTTHTYDPMKGMTSKTDGAGTTVFYEYDAFQRLWRIRDDEGNTLEEYKYNYRMN